MLKVNTRDWLSFIEHQFVNGACPPVHSTFLSVAILSMSICVRRSKAKAQMLHFT